MSVRVGCVGLLARLSGGGLDEAFELGQVASHAVLEQLGREWAEVADGPGKAGAADAAVELDAGGPAGPGCRV